MTLVEQNLNGKIKSNGVCLQVQNVGKTFYNYDERGVKNVLWNVNFEIRAGQIVALVGPSGCGKSTLLKAILGTHPPTTGQILADGELVTKPSRHVGIVYQDYALYPFMTTLDNVAFGLKVDESNILYRMFCPWGWRKLRKQHRQQAMDMLTRVRLNESAKCYPSELSGGMRQRVAVAQSLIMRPSILLMDEPFGALDESTRENLQLMLLSLYQENIKAKKAGQRPPYTILIVTHELNEALYVSDRVIGLSQYHAEGQKGATIVYDQPSPVFRPDEPKDFERFAKQKEDIRDVVFSPRNKDRHRSLIKLWHESKPEELPGDERI